MFDEIDYVLEGKNADRFATLYSHGEFCNLFYSSPDSHYVCIHPPNMGF